jgi:hypothetical protein
LDFKFWLWSLYSFQKIYFDLKKEGGKEAKSMSAARDANWWPAG